MRSTREHVEGADSKIGFDRFHVAKLLAEAVNQVRKQENRELAEQDAYVPKRTKCLFVSNFENLSAARKHLFELVRDQVNEVARAWSLKEAARWLWA